MDAPSLHAARPDPKAVEKRPEIVAGAVAAKLRADHPAVEVEAGTEFDKALRAHLDAFERKHRA